jgi:enoyl-CoA hydratase/carnithine racemase
MRSPKDLNCLSEIMLKELSQAILKMHNDEVVNVIVIVS